MLVANYALAYKDISIVPRHVSNIASRTTLKNNNATLVEFAGQKLQIPIIAAPMPDVCDGKMASHLVMGGSYGFIHRFMTPEEQVNEFNSCKCLAIEKIEGLYTILGDHSCGCAVGINEEDYLLRVEKLMRADCASFCIDIANGANSRIEKVIENIDKAKWLHSQHKKIYITVGNVASAQCFEYLAKIPEVYAIRVGIAGGSVCTTRTETGIYHPMASLIHECAEVNKKYNKILIADGSIKEPQDMCKALALGANLCMAGSMFASCEESPAKTIRVDGKLCKLFRGAASFSTQQDFGKKPEYVEGRESLIGYTGSVSKILKRYQNGLLSSMSYLNAHNLEEYTQNASFVRVNT